MAVEELPKQEIALIFAKVQSVALRFSAFEAFLWKTSHINMNLVL
jgi:hypothetical protein